MDTDPSAADDVDVIYRGDWITLRAMRRRNGTLPAKEWADGLEAKGKGQLLAAVSILEISIRSGRPPAGRAELIKKSRLRLWELKVTKPGSTAPHLRLLYVRQGPTLWGANGFTKQKNELGAADVEEGDRIADEWYQREEK